jgi:hypothetical protein
VSNYNTILDHNYLKLKLGSQQFIYNISDYTDNNILKMFQFSTKMPSHFELILQLWEKNILTQDDLIGETRIDLENRFFSPNFRKLPEIPIETRPLLSSFSKEKKGEIKLFLEIIPVDDNKKIERVWFIDRKPKTEIEIRFLNDKIYSSAKLKIKID